MRTAIIILTINSVVGVSRVQERDSHLLTPFISWVRAGWLALLWDCSLYPFDPRLGFLVPFLTLTPDYSSISTILCHTPFHVYERVSYLFGHLSFN